MAEWELTPRLATCLDRHLTLTLLEFLSSNNIHDEQELFHARMELLSKTKMIDFAIDVHSKIHPGEEVPAALIANRSDVVEEFKEITEQTKPILAIFDDEAIIHEIESISDGRQLFEYLEKNHGLTADMVDTLYKFAKFQYECGNYTGAANYLSSHRSLITPSDKYYLDNLWGKLASEILMQKWENALEELTRLREHIDGASGFTPLQLLQQRTWLIHWSLFIFFNHSQGRDLLIELLLERPNQKSQQPYLNAVQTICPHIIRYLAATVITHRRRRDYMKELVKVIQQEAYTYRDPVTDFVLCLCVQFDFDGAQRKLRECVDVFKNDFFLTALQKEFIEHARLFVFEVFCRIHQCISIRMLSEKLNMREEEAEVWIVNLIRQARLDAKIDSKQGHVVMGTQAVSPYQQLVEKTKAMAIRCQVLVMNVEKRLNWTESNA